MWPPIGFIISTPSEIKMWTRERAEKEDKGREMANPTNQGLLSAMFCHPRELEIPSVLGGGGGGSAFSPIFNPTENYQFQFISFADRPVAPCFEAAIRPLPSADPQCERGPSQWKSGHISRREQGRRRRLYYRTTHSHAGAG